ncbi:MAG: hypothetical protein U0800_05490 [Isosphaeraceae bacterium]
MSRLGIVAALAVAAAGCGPKLREYTHAQDGFAVKLPGTPSRTAQTTPGPFGPITYQAHSLKAGPVEYTVTYNELPRGFGFGMSPWDGPMSRLGGAVAGALEKGGKLVEQSDVTLCGHPGRELTLELPGGGRYRGRMFVVGSKFYQVVVTAPAAGFPEDRAREVLDSFTLLDYQGQPIRQVARQDVPIPVSEPTTSQPPPSASPGFSGGSFAQP